MSKGKKEHTNACTTDIFCLYLLKCVMHEPGSGCKNLFHIYSEVPVIHALECILITCGASLQSKFKSELFIVSTNQKRSAGDFHSVIAVQGQTGKGNLTIHSCIHVVFIGIIYNQHRKKEVLYYPGSCHLFIYRALRSVHVGSRPYRKQSTSSRNLSACLQIKFFSSFLLFVTFKY